MTTAVADNNNADNAAQVQDYQPYVFMLGIVFPEVEFQDIAQHADRELTWIYFTAFYALGLCGY